MGAAAELHIGGFGEFIAENFLAARTDERVMRIGIDDQNQIGEVVDQAAREFLFLVELALHLAAGSDVHDRALITDHAAGGVTDGGGRVQTDNGSAILAQEIDFAALGRRLALDFFHKRFSLAVVGENIRNVHGEQFFLGVIAEHADESGIRVEDVALGRGDVDAFLERFKEFGEASFILAQRGDVAAENGEAVDFVVAGHGMGDAIVIADRVLLLKAHLDDAGPMAALDETRHSAANQLLAFATAFFEEIRHRAADNLLVVGTDEVAKAAIHGADFALEREGDEDVVEGIDEVAVALLGAGDNREELVELPVAGRSGIMLLQAADKTAEFGDFLSALPGIGDEEQHHDHESGKKGFEALRERPYGAPGNDRKSDGDRKKDEKSHAPELALSFFEEIEARGDGGAVRAA